MLNIEKHKEEIKKIGIISLTVKTTGEPTNCNKIIINDCKDCAFYHNDGRCNRSDEIVDWLIEEYKEQPKLTKEERAFCEFVKTGWIARDKNNTIGIYKEYPKRFGKIWDADSGVVAILAKIRKDGDDLFPFIKWEDEEPWSIEELLKLEVEGGQNEI